MWKWSVTGLAAVLLLCSAGCQHNAWHPTNQFCVINAQTQKPEPDVLIAFTDQRSGQTTYGKTDSLGRAYLDIPATGWGSMNSNKFKVRAGKIGFDTPIYCDYAYPAHVLPANAGSYSVFCIVPDGVDRARIGHDHQRKPIPTVDQQILQAEWEALEKTRK